MTPERWPGRGVGACCSRPVGAGQGQVTPLNPNHTGQYRVGSIERCLVGDWELHQPPGRGGQGRLWQQRRFLALTEMELCASRGGLLVLFQFCRTQGDDQFIPPLFPRQQPASHRAALTCTAAPLPSQSHAAARQRVTRRTMIRNNGRDLAKPRHRFLGGH